MRVSLLVVTPPASRALHLRASNRRVHTHLLRAIVRSPAQLKKLAIVDSGTHNTKRWSYEEIVLNSLKLARALRAQNIQEPTIAAFQKASSNYVSTMLATWMVGKRFLPLCTTHPEAELRYFIEDSRAGCIVFTSHEACDKHSYQALPRLGVPLLDCSPLGLDGSGEPGEAAACPAPDMASDALILYTSGTTGRPKGVVHTHHGVTCMMQGLLQSWRYSPHDHILHFLPLHHLHGVLNKLLCMLYAGGSVEFMQSAQAEGLWRRLARGTGHGQHADKAEKTTLFMAVPTVYARMIEYAQDTARRPDDGGGATQDREMLQRALAAIRSDMRLMACGSAALPDNVMNTWRQLTGQVLLERYGMTEIGMALTNDYEPVENRTPGQVGRPFPFVAVRLVDDYGCEIPGSNSTEQMPPVTGKDADEAVPGELRVKGPTVFREYLNRPEVYRESFDEQGWFRTGDVAVRQRSGAYAILGRSSTDIIKARGYKLSALEIERELLACDALVKEVAVLGCPHAMDGEMVVAIVVLQPDAAALLPDACTPQIKALLKDRLALYKSPTKYLYVDQLPRNALGKVNKKTLLKDLNIVV